MKLTLIARIADKGVRACVIEVDTFDPVRYLRDNPDVLEVQTEVFDYEAGVYVTSAPLHRDQVNPVYLGE